MWAHSHSLFLFFPRKILEIISSPVMPHKPHLYFPQKICLPVHEKHGCMSSTVLGSWWRSVDEPPGGPGLEQRYSLHPVHCSDRRINGVPRTRRAFPEGLCESFDMQFELLRQSLGLALHTARGDRTGIDPCSRISSFRGTANTQRHRFVSPFPLCDVNVTVSEVTREADHRVPSVQSHRPRKDPVTLTLHRYNPRRV